jgi:DNA invertase Pin-like site-specific DNA recombinase
VKVDAYLRVSSTKGRDPSGESFITTDEQRRAIEAYAAAHKLEVAEWWTDLDQSGGTLERPEFQKALERCRSGETGGIIAAKLDRLTRSTIGLGTLIEEARSGGWNLIAVDFGLDLFSANGELVANVLGSVAQWERKRRGDDWSAARRNAIERGIPNGRVPLGYRKQDKHPVIVEKQAAKVREAFSLRAAGTPFSQIAKRFRWSHSTTRQMLCNEAYIGIARSGEFVNEHAFPPIVTRQEFEAAQAGRTTQPVPAGETTKGLLLLGLARCAGCGRTLKAIRRKRADGSFVGAYYCKNAASELCTDRAYVHTDELDSYIGGWFTDALKTVPRMIDVVAAGLELDAAQAEQAQAEAQLAAYVENADALDAALFQRGLASRQGRLESAQEAVRHLSARLTRLPAGGSLLNLWADFSASESREVLGGFLDRVEVSRGASSDLAGNVRIVWADGTNEEAGIRKAAA